jgi:alpha-mannosidase
VASIYDKPGRREIIARGEQACVLSVASGTGTERAVLRQTDLLETGPSRATIRCEFAYRKSSIVQDMVLYESVPRVDVKVTVDWQEPAAEKPRLRLVVPTSIAGSNASFESGAGVNGPSGWVDLSCGDYGLSLINDHAYPCIRDGGTLTVLPSGDGLYEFAYSLYPHAGRFSKTSAERFAMDVLTPLNVSVARSTSEKTAQAPTDQSAIHTGTGGSDR